MYKDITIEDMLSHIQKSPKRCVLVDVRTAQEWRQTGIADVLCAVETITVVSGLDKQLLDDYQPTLVATIDPTKTLYFICRSGVRSQVAASIAVQNNMPESYNVLEGMQGWIGRGLPTKFK